MPENCDLDNCEKMRLLRVAPLGIVQDHDCVTWGRLVQMREIYNTTFWTPLMACGLIDHDEFGKLPHQEEIDTLPSVAGFFRIIVEVTGNDEDGYEANVESNTFIVTACEFLTRLGDPATWTYIDSTKSYYLFIKDNCGGCAKLFPTSVDSALLSIACPVGVFHDYYTGLKRLEYGAAPAACGIATDWGSKKSELEKFIYKFPARFKTDITDDTLCSSEKIYCCEEQVVTARYHATVDPEDPTMQILTLKVIEINGTEDGGSYLGYVTGFIEYSDLQNIKDFVQTEIENFFPIPCALCDGCGPEQSLTDGFCLGAENPQDLAFSCENAYTWEDVIKATGVQGYFHPDCNPCTDGFSGIICTCPWEELAQVMIFVSADYCIHECSPCPCNCSSSSSSSAESPAP